MDRAISLRATLFADEECRVDRRGDECIAALGIIGNHGDGGQMDQDEPELA